MSTLVLVDDVPAAAELLPHVGHLQAEGSVLALQEGGAHRNLVLLQPAGVARALGRLVVLHPPAPVLLVLGGWRRPPPCMYVCVHVFGGEKTKRWRWWW